MSTQPFTAGKFQAFDSNGLPLSGGLLYSYVAGTTTPLSTYTTRAGNIANANPVVLDANGQADVWMSPGVLYKFVLKNSAAVLQWTEDNFPSPYDVTISTNSVAYEPGGRLTLTSGTPVTNTDVTSATTIYYEPYVSDQVPLYDGANWILYSIGAQLSQATTDNTKSPAAVSANSNYDFFIWNDAGTIRLSRGPAWTSDTSRGSGVGTTGLARVNGRLVNANAITNGPGANMGLYVGTMRSDSSAKANDSFPNRHLWNMYSRVRKSLRSPQESSSTWTYAIAAWRQANANTANQVNMVRGLDEDSVDAVVSTVAINDTSTQEAGAAVGLDSTTAIASGTILGGHISGTSTTGSKQIGSHWTGWPGLGSHYLAWLEYASATGATSWSGKDTVLGAQFGISAVSLF